MTRDKKGKKDGKKKIKRGKNGRQNKRKGERKKKVWRKSKVYENMERKTERAEINLGWGKRKRNIKK